jgi:hypothetical protein
MESSPKRCILSLCVLQNAVVTMYTTCILYVLPTRCFQASFMIQAIYSDHIPTQNLACGPFNEGAVCVLCSRNWIFKLMLPLNNISNIRYIKPKQVKCNKGKGLPQQAEVAQGVPGRLRPRIFLTFGITRVAGRQQYAPAAFTPGEIPGTHF